MQQTNTYNGRLPIARSPQKLQYSDFNWQLIKDLIGFIVLFALAVISVYKMPQSLSKIFFLGLVVLFWFSKKDYFWFALYFVIIQAPGYFFASFGAAGLYSIPIFTLVSGMSVSALDLFAILALIKAVLKGKRTKLKLEMPLILILAYIVFALFVSIANGAQIGLLANVLRGPFYYSIIISFFYLVTKKEDVYRFIFIVSSTVFFIFFTQIYSLITRDAFINLFFPSFRRVALIEGTQDVRAIGGGVLIIFFGFLFSLFLLEEKKNRISRKYLYVVSIIAYLSIVISATRIWFAVFSFIYIGYILMSKKKVSNTLKIATVFAVLIIILISSGVFSLDFFTKGVLGRLQGLASVAKGDYHSVSTFERRYFFRLPRLLEGVKENLIFGCGFTQTYLKYRDYHVGFFNTILQFGIIGFCFFLYLFMSYFALIKKSLEKLRSTNPLRFPLKLLSLFFGGILLAHFTTWYFFQMSTNEGPPFFIAVFIAITEVFIREAKKEKK